MLRRPFQPVRVSKLKDGKKTSRRFTLIIFLFKLRNIGSFVQKLFLDHPQYRMILNKHNLILQMGLAWRIKPDLI